MGDETVRKAEHWTSLREVLAEVLQKPADQRLAALRSRVSDPDLLAEAEHLLGLDSEASAMFGISGWRALAGGEPSVEEATGGSVIGQYRIVREIGRGGMGAVYLAERADGTYDQRVAIKLLQESISSPELERRFRSERQILAGLNHPGVARLLDGGVTAAGRPYLVLEYVEGLPVDKYCDEKELDIPARLRLFVKIAEIVQASHQQLVLHLDLKPANILITPEGEPRLLDFGLARLLADGEVTQPSLMLMTPRYASPEQVAGTPLGVASDVFSLSTLLYRVLTGKLPYPMEQATPLEAARMIRETEPRLPSKAAEPALASQLRGDLDTILMMGLRKEPTRRYPTIAAMSADVARFLDSRPVHAHKNSFAYRSRKFLSRHRVAVAAAAVILLVLTGSVAAVVRSAMVARRERASALSSAAVAERERNRAEAAAKQADRQEHLAQRSEKVAEHERTAAEQSAALAVRERSSAERSAGAAEQSAAAAERDRASAERRLTDIQDLARFYVMDLFPSVTDVPGTLPVQKKMTENALKYLQSMAQDRGKDPKFSADLAAGLYSMALVQGFPNKPSLGDRQGALDLFSMAIEMQKRHQREAPDDPSSHARMGLMLAMKSNVKNALGDVPEAIALEQQAWDEVQPVLQGPKSNRWMQISTYCFFRATYLSLDSQFHMANPEEALVWINRSEKLLTDLTAEKPEFLQNPQYVTALENTRMAKAWYLHQLRREDEARALYEQQLAVADAQKDSTSLEIQHHRRDVHAAYADFLIDHGEIDRAIALSSILMPHRDVEVHTGDDTWDQTDMSSELSRATVLSMHKGRTEEAMRTMQDSLAMSRWLHEHVPNDHILSAQLVMNLVTMAAAPHMPAQRAAPMFHEAIAITTEYSRAHPTVLSSQLWEARAHLGLARVAQQERRTAERDREAAKAADMLKAILAERTRLPEAQEMLASAGTLRD